MEERKAAPVRRIDAPAQVVPVLDLMHRFVADDLFQDQRGGPPIDAPQHQEAAIEPGREEMHEILVHWREVFAVRHRVHQVFAHRDQRRGAAGRQIEPAEQLLPARLGRAMQFERGLVGALARPVVYRRIDPLAVDAIARGERLEEGDTRAGGQLVVAGEELACERDARGFAASGQEFLAKLDQAVRLCRSVTAAIACAIDQGAATLRDGLEQFAEKRGVHSGLTPCLRRRCRQSGPAAIRPAVALRPRFHLALAPAIRYRLDPKGTRTLAKTA